MESISKLDWINDYKKVESKDDAKDKDISLEQMIQELKKQTNDYQKKNEVFYAKVDEQLAEIKSLVRYTLSEQEKQRITSMSMTELLFEMQKNISKINTLIENWGDK